MVSSSLVDALVSPSATVRDLFAKTVTEGRAHDFPSIVRDHFSALFSDDALDQVPMLDIDHPPESYAPMSLVRFRAMVQDTSCSPEMYLSSLKDSKCGGWGLDDLDEIPAILDLRSDSNILKERDVVWAVTIPGEGHWCSPSHNATTSGSATATVSAPPVNTRKQGCKPHKYPIPDSRHVAAQLKIYDDSAETLKPTSVHEFIGILTSESIHSEFDAEITTPTVHVAFCRQIFRPAPSGRVPDGEESSGNVVRDKLINWMASEVLGGDCDAAEWVLLSCLSSVESRTPPLLPVSIALSGFPRHPTAGIPSLSHALSELLSLHFLLPLSLKLLNEQSFFPESKDEDLHAGILQVPADTTIVITETSMEEGRLGEKGLENVKALREVAKTQMLQYKFPFSQYSFPTDIKLIILTDGKKSLFLDTGVNVPLRTDAPSDLYKDKASICWPPPETLSEFREFIARAKEVKVSTGEELSEHIKDEFVRQRQEKGSITPDDLARRMRVARLIAMSRLENRLSLESWNAAKALDDRRKSRL